MTESRAQSTSLVQAIAVVPGTHFETIAAVATASALAALTRGADPETPSVWDTWLAGSFTKTVRRATRPAQIRKLIEDETSVAVHRAGGAAAFAYAPMPYDEFPAHLRKLQVTGLDVDRSLDRWGLSWQSPTTPTGPHGLEAQILISEQAAMTTGKTAAQVAHALVAWTQLLTDDQKLAWIKSPVVRLIVDDIDHYDPARCITIRDNGLTEIEPGTVTVRIATP